MAGAYCKFCGNRCFVYRGLPDGSWSGHMATCAAGAAFDREKTGYDYTTAVNPHADITPTAMRSVADAITGRRS